MLNAESVRIPLSYDRDAASAESALVPEGPSLTIQSQAAEADINNIVKAFGITGHVPTTIRVPLAEDFYDIEDYQSCMNALISAQRAFDALPAALRRELNHDPAAFVAFCEDPANLDRLRKLGMAIAAPEASGADTSTPATAPA